MQRHAAPTAVRLSRPRAGPGENDQLGPLLDHVADGEPQPLHPVPSAGAAIVCSIFIASITISGWPRRTLLPGSTSSRVTRPGIGAVSRPPAGSSSPARARAGRSRSSRQLSPSMNTAVCGAVIEHDDPPAPPVEHQAAARRPAAFRPLAAMVRSPIRSSQPQRARSPRRSAARPARHCRERRYPGACPVEPPAIVPGPGRIRVARTAAPRLQPPPRGRRAGTAPRPRAPCRGPAGAAAAAPRDGAR